MKIDVGTVPGDLVMIKRNRPWSVDSAMLTSTPAFVDHRATRSYAGRFMTDQVGLVLGVSVAQEPSWLSPVMDILIITSGCEVGWVPGEMVEVVVR